jgi:hypothetical protein
MAVITALRRQLRHTWVKCVYATQSVLSPGQVMVLDRPGQVLRVTSGNVWVTVGKEDILVQKNEVFRLPAGAKRALVTGLGKKGNAYETYCETDQNVASV